LPRICFFEFRVSRGAFVLNSPVQATFIEAVRRLQAGRASEAEQLFAQVLRIDPRHADSLHLQGVIALQGGRPLVAAELIGKAIAVNGEAAPFHSNLGNALQALGRAGEAEQSYRRALRLKPDYPDAANNLGNLLRESGRAAEAEGLYRQALRFLPPRHPKTALTLRNLGGALRDLDRRNEAEAAFRAALEQNPGDAAAHDHHATVLRELDQLDDAESSQLRALALAPHEAEFHLDHANLLKAMGRVGAARISCGRALAIAPDSAEAHNCLGGLLFDLGEAGAAEAEMRRALELAPGRLVYQLSFAATHRFREDDPRLAQLRDLVAANEAASDLDRAHLHFALAKAYEDIGAKDLSFAQQILGNRAKRRSFDYDEAAALGQMERIAEILSADFMARHWRGIGAADGPIFIIGMMRSGSTLVEQILASHPQVFGAGELTLFKQIAGKAGGQARYPEPVAGLGDAAIAEIGRLYESRLRLEAPGTARITDKFLHNFLYCGLIALALPHARIIHMVRDPIDSCLSIYSKLFVGHHPYAYDLAELGRYYRAYRKLMAHWRRVLPDGMMIDIAYESVVGDLEGETRRILAHCGLPWDDACLAFHRTERAVRTASATQVRQPIYRDSVGRWRPAEDQLAPLVAALAR
jgi:tetratricopeptide (TPR) repeat protein